MLSTDLLECTHIPAHLVHTLPFVLQSRRDTDFPLFHAIASSTTSSMIKIRISMKEETGLEEIFQVPATATTSLLSNQSCRGSGVSESPDSQIQMLRVHSSKMLVLSF